MPLRIGLIGAGDNTRVRHIPGLRAVPDVEVMSLVNRSRESSERVASQFGIPRVAESVEAYFLNLNTHFAVAGRMAHRGGGRIINIASDAAKVGTAMEAVYSACKGGLISFTKSIARELARKNVLANCVCPGPTNTPMMAEVAGEGPDAEKWKEALVRGIPLRRMGEPEDYAGIVALLASDDGAYITGQAISVSGGMNMV